jgi:hypothetical protein
MRIGSHEIPDKFGRGKESVGLAGEGVNAGAGVVAESTIPGLAGSGGGRYFMVCEG